MLKKNLTALLLICIVTSCTTNDSYAPVVNRSRIESITSIFYRVQAEDTLYSIAWASELDYRQLAKINRLKPPYRLHPGDRLRVRLPTLQVARLKKTSLNARRPNKSPVIPKAKIFSLSELPKPQSSVEMTRKEKKYPSKSTLNEANMNHKTRDPSQVRKAGGARISATFANGIKSQKQAQIHDSKNASNEINEQGVRKDLIFTKISVHSFMWPTRGKVVGQYSSGQLGNKGIDIVGQFGQPVRASRAGLVVYSGSGLRGYGNLIIIKHNASFLSAYAHNAELKVTEGTQVKAGQEIATMGRATSGQPMLHFEIRRDGRPINPTQYLR